MPHDVAAMHGVVPPVVTPLNPDFSVDYPSFTRVIEHLIQGGVHGLFFLGSTSEVVFHGEAARRAILEHAVKVVNGRLPVLTGVVDPTTDRVVEHGRVAKSIGVDGVVVTAPFYTRTSQPEIIDHFRFVRDGVGLPVIAYDIPVCVHVKLERPTVLALAAEGVIAGLKDSSGDDGNLRAVMMETAGKMWSMTGSEIVVDGVLQMGAQGVVPGLGNVDPAGYVRLYDAAKRGDWAAARQEQERLCRLFGMVTAGLPRTSFGSSGVGSFKTAMKALGIIDHNTMARPQRTLNAEETEIVLRHLREAGLLAR
jgi:4-hydroxy-tetrahydrodipicolinate synthase